MTRAGTSIVERPASDLMRDILGNELDRCAKRANVKKTKLLEKAGLLQTWERLCSGKKLTEPKLGLFEKTIFETYSEKKTIAELRKFYETTYLPIIKSEEIFKKINWGPEQASKKYRNDRMDRIRNKSGLSVKDFDKLETYEDFLLGQSTALLRLNKFGEVIADVLAITAYLDTHQVGNENDRIQLRNNFTILGLSACAGGGDSKNKSRIFRESRQFHYSGQRDLVRAGQEYLCQYGYQMPIFSSRVEHDYSLWAGGMNTIEKFMEDSLDDYHKTSVASAMAFAQSTIITPFGNFDSPSYKKLIEVEQRQSQIKDVSAIMRLHALMLGYIESYIFDSDFHYSMESKDIFKWGESELCACYDSMVKFRETSYSLWHMWYELANKFFDGLGNTAGARMALVQREAIYKMQKDYNAAGLTRSVIHGVGETTLGEYSIPKPYADPETDWDGFLEYGYFYGVAAELLNRCMEQPPCLQFIKEVDQLD